MNRLEKVLYTAKAHTTGGRAGMSRSSDGRLEVKLSRPGTPGTGTNPEQLFAAGWSACFESAMEFAFPIFVKRIYACRQITPSTPRIDLGPDGGAFSLAARLYVSLPGMERATAERLVEAAHQVCPYSRATHGNIAIETTQWSVAEDTLNWVRLRERGETFKKVASGELTPARCRNGLKRSESPPRPRRRAESSDDLDDDIPF